MSLFSSAFEVNIPEGSSTSFTSQSIGLTNNVGKSSNDKKKDGKRKRPELETSNKTAKSAPQLVRGDKNNLKSIKQNLEKVLSRPGLSSPHSTVRKEGREEMGLATKQKQQRPFEHDRNTLNESNFKPDKKANGKGVESKKSVEGMRDGKKDKLAPAELPMPHDIKFDSRGEEGLTKMQQGLKSKLDGARFRRWINEQLYSSRSTDAVEMMSRDPKIFSDYHLSHRSLTAAWPSPPLPAIISRLRPLPPRTVIVDLGCGEAGLAKALVPEGKTVLSYDLVGDVHNTSGEGWVVEADFLEGIPLPGRSGGILSENDRSEPDAMRSGKKNKNKRKLNGSESTSEIVDVVVCCLSLMGLNWLGGIYEACRVSKKGGQLHIAEVTSRFVSTESFIEAIQSFGFSLVSQESPSTHFTLFEFVKTSDVPQGPARGQVGWEERIKKGENILRGCVYKKR
ncbi:hypothetical protein M231_01090 [Tremella mesenterica]|uniref:Ribosomal RNA-processing protein 8 n=1 Tax=Tremella mesenterica TaxID=5217 RepID=A0A4Q1BU23_TREME|nr:hypothetical protein M231_01090 [Tremella mesenterica]